MDLNFHNETFKQKQGKPEFVEEITVAKAYIILYNIQLNNWADVYLFCASINLINTYVKQPNSKVGYAFKSRTHFLANTLAQNTFEGIKIDSKISPSNSLFIVDIYGIQFSFHNVRFDEEIWKRLKDYQAQIPWDGIRKQKCANTIFEVSYALKERTNLTKYSENLDDFINDIIEKYNEGIFILEKRGLINIDGTFC